MSDQEQHTIKPAEIALTALSSKSQQQGIDQRRHSYMIWVGLIVLAFLAYVVIFILPGKIKTVPVATADNTAATSPNTVAPQAAVTGASTGSPWSEAQLAKQRKEAQDILADMLNQQEALEKIGVQEWAAEEYARALQLAEAGDDYYRQREFAQALESYQAGLDELNRLLQASESIFADALRDGDQALVDGNSSAAQAAFQLALLIKPNDTSAGKGKARAETLDQVLGLLAQGDALMQAGQLADAATVYQQALTLDPDHSGASDRLTMTRQRITDRDFTAAMSKGYAALAGDELEQARKSFQRALQIKPAAGEARDGLRQTDNKITVININKLLADAAQHEDTEHWPEAATAYEQALKLDPNLAIAESGKQAATLRADLDQRLAFTMANPLRLAEPPVYEAVRALHKQAMTISTPGPKLKRQLAAVQKLLEQARKPRLVTLQSDNLTEITLYKTGKLGQFLTRQIELIPGQYVIVGKRQGYQDIRVEFTVDPDKPVNPVMVQCVNKLAF